MLLLRTLHLLHNLGGSSSKLHQLSLPVLTFQSQRPSRRFQAVRLCTASAMGTQSAQDAKEEDQSHTSVSAGTSMENASGAEELGKELNFVSRLNCTTGKVEWVELPDDYDFHQEIARSAYADMLHDHDRNLRYYQALKYEIAKLKAQGEAAHVLDIGTGTGLLSMMAVEAGADSVFACDAFTPMLECSRKVVKRNGYGHRIKLIPKRSTELKVGVDIPYRCNVLVTEVFDTELIGEGAISTFNHAHKELLTENAVVIPASSTVYAQVMSSPEVEKWNTFPAQLSFGGASSVKINFPPEVSSCAGIPSVQDLQLDAIQRNEFTPLSAPIPIFTFDFTNKSPIPSYRSKSIEFNVEANDPPCRANAVFLWWDLDMDTSGENVLSCQPGYVQDGPKNWFESCPPQTAAWRDHWMHSVYYVPRSTSLTCGEQATFHFAHDEYAFWFDVVKKCEEKHEFPSMHPICNCRVHNTISRYQFYMMNDIERYETFIETYRKLIVPGETVCLCLSDCSLLPLILAQLGAAKVFVIETCPENERVSKRIVGANSGRVGSDKIEFVGAEPEKLSPDVLKGLKIDLITGDPHFHVAVYPWNNLMFWYLSQTISPAVLSPRVILAPYKGIVRGVAVSFNHLWKIRAPVKKAVGEFDLVDFDELITHSSSISDSPVDAQPLWEYESTATSAPVKLLEFNLSEIPQRLSNQGELKIETCGSLPTNGIAIWIDWQLDDDDRAVLSTGPRQPVKPGEKIVWHRFSKQGVYFIDDDQQSQKTALIHFTISFDDSTGDLMFTFK